MEFCDGRGPVSVPCRTTFNLWNRRACRFQELTKAEEKMKLAIVHRRSMCFLLAASSAEWINSGKFFLDTASAELLRCLRGRGNREIHRQMQVYACQLSEIARQ
jgi:hypothetical protein